jgi:membrane-associated protease RseP (regulator of RpoE activity)
VTKKQRNRLIQLSLFGLTFIFTTIAGGEWMGKFIWSGEYSWDDFRAGLAYSVPFLLILTVHEFGHYFTAQWHRVKVTLPYYIPFWFFGLGPSIGTMGAFISIQQKKLTLKQYFDIGVAGPLAGFVVALGVLYYGFTHLPPPEYVFEMHPEYEYFGMDYEEYVYGYDTFYTREAYEARLNKPAPEHWPDTLYFGQNQADFRLGNNLIMTYFKENVATQPERVPNVREMMHYPWLFAGYLALFFTALNLLPIGQLDGGHVVFGLFGRNYHTLISKTLFVIFIFYAGLGLVTPYDEASALVINIPLYVLGLTYIFFSMSESFQTRLTLALSVFTVQFAIGFLNPNIEGYVGWLVFGLLIGRFIGVKHPPAIDNQPLTMTRKVIGWIALLVFILCFSPQPFVVN